jgi:hypothetical protein
MSPGGVVALHEMAKYIWRAKKAEGEDCRNANGEQRLSRNLAERGGEDTVDTSLRPSRLRIVITPREYRYRKNKARLRLIEASGISAAPAPGATVTSHDRHARPRRQIARFAGCQIVRFNLTV